MTIRTQRKASVDSSQPKDGGLRAAFTLIELLVVMVIATIIMAVSLPSFISMGRGASMRTAVNNIRSAAALSRQWAITHREQITFVVSPTGMVYTTNSVIVLATNDHACFYAVTTADTNSMVQSITDLPLDVTFDSPTPQYFVFKTDGGLKDLTPPDIVLVDKASKIRGNMIKKAISINGLTGGITVE